MNKGMRKYVSKRAWLAAMALCGTVLLGGMQGAEAAEPKDIRAVPDKADERATGNSIVASDQAYAINGGAYRVYPDDKYILVGGGREITSNNTIKIKNITINKTTDGYDVYGAKPKTSSKASPATGNSITIINSSILSGVIGGGTSYSGDGVYSKNNTIILDSSYIWYSLAGGTDGNGRYENNKLVITGGHSHVEGINSINTIEFGEGIEWNPEKPALQVGKSLIDKPETVTVDTTNISFTGPSLQKIQSEGKYQMYLLKGTSYATDTGLRKLTAGVKPWTYGNSLTGTGEASFDANYNVIYTMYVGGESLKAQEETHAAVMGTSAGIAAVSAAGVSSMVQASQSLMTAVPAQTMTFANFGGGTDKYKTGSDVTSRMWRGSVGAGTKTNLKNGGSVTYGAFFEYGKGNYTTHNEHATFTRGDGKLSYLGGGIVARYTTPSKFYTEIGFHTGRLKNDADHVLVDTDGTSYGYKTTTTYFGANLGIGQIFDVSDRSNVDVYSTFYYNHNGGSSFDSTDPSGDMTHYDLDAVNSRLLRIGARYNYQMNKAAKLYAGAALDYEFDSRAKGTVSAFGFATPIRSSDSRGASGMLELGVRMESDDSPWVLDLGAKAFTGKHSGVTGNLGIKFLF